MFDGDRVPVVTEVLDEVTVVNGNNSIANGSESFRMAA